MTTIIYGFLVVVFFFRLSIWDNLETVRSTTKYVMEYSVKYKKIFLEFCD